MRTGQSDRGPQRTRSALARRDSERASHGLVGPFALCGLDPVVGRIQPDDVDLVFAVPPSPDFGVRIETAAANRRPDRLATDLLEGSGDAIRELVDHNDELPVGEPLTEIRKGVVSAVDPGNAIVELRRDLFDELLALAGFGLLCCEKIHVRAIGTEAFEQLGLSDPPTPYTT